nr:alk-exo [Mamestra brassicae multiple nucleopolyhedrovirus]WNA17427.1 alk-exo [Alphabaculovirus mabrassicae]
MAARVLSDEDLELFKTYAYSNYVTRLVCNKWRLPSEEIMRVERATRNQSKNPLWNMLRLDRQTASASCQNRDPPQNEAMNYGSHQETVVKKNSELIAMIENLIEYTLKVKIKDKVLECGMFLSQFGLFSASPDAYFVLETGVLVPIEIKCPWTYREKNIEDVRRALRDRQPRYRVENTSFSVNKRGAPLFVVEKTTPHYRQMQRQMYVMNSPMCVYVVKFGTEFVVNTVMRDETFCLQQYDAEKKLFDMFVSKNQCMLRFKNVAARVQSFKNQRYNDKDIGLLADLGFYYAFGQLKCIFCESVYDVDVAVAKVLQLHASCNNGKPVQVSSSSAQEYLNHNKRVESLTNNGVTDVNLAKQGVYHDGVQLKTFCCNTDVGFNNAVTHTKDCYYVKLL